MDANASDAAEIRSPTRSIVGRALFYGSPCLAAAIVVSFVYLDHAGLWNTGRYGEPLLIGNAAIATIGSACGGVLGRGGFGGRLGIAIASGVLGLIAYAVLFLSGVLAFLE